MDVLNMLINDTVVLYSFIGLAILLGICGFYVYYFLKHISEDEK
jgi:hypothetical protein